MKKQFLLFGAVLFGVSAFAQQAPTNTAPGGVAPSGQNNQQFWSRAGNSNVIGNNNIFGTLWNSPIYTQTNGANRMKLNGSFGVAGSPQYTIDGYGTAQGVNTTGYLLLGPNSNTGAGFLYDGNRGAFSQLHLNGVNGGQSFGYRPWMQTGISYTSNNDFSYIGQRQVGTGFDVTETTIAWADNNASPFGPDDMVFRFMDPGSSNTTINTNLLNGNDLDGLHVARFAGTGQFGLGNTFGSNPVGTPAGLYVRPQSLFHMSYQFRTGAVGQPFGFQQITYRRANGTGADIIGQGETATDGLRFGIDNQVFNTGGLNYLNSYLRWQEASSFIIQTEDGGAANIEANERMRVTSVGALTLNHGVNYQGITVPTNRTRIAISADGANPITRPLSLLHLGFNTGAISFPTPGTDGWRPWMDLGVFTTNGSDNVYLGLKQETGPAGDRQDAVLSWGDNQTSGLPPGNGPDNFRMIFTSTTAASGGGTPPATGANGLEGMRMTPTTATGVFTGIGGDPTANQYGPAGNSLNPTATLEVNSWGATNVAGGNSGLRFTNLNSTSPTIVNPGAGVLSVDADGDVIYVEAPTSGGGSGPFGAACSDNVNGKLQFDTKVDLNDNSLYFVNAASPMTLAENRMGIGYPCATPLPGKLGVRQLHDQSVSVSTTAGHFYNSDTANAILLTFTGVQGIADGLQNPTFRPINIGGKFSSRNSGVNHGINIDITNNALNGSINYGILNRVEDYNSSFSYGMRSETRGATAHAYGLYVVAASNFTSNPVQTQQTTGISVYSFGGTSDNIGVRAVSGGDDIGAYAFGGVNFGVKAYAKYGTSNYAIYGETTPGQPNSYAGYFVGQVVQNQPSVPSDQQFKTNVEDIANADSLLKVIRPVTYDYQTTGNSLRMNFPSGIQYGMIAQEVESVMPELVKTVVHPAVKDSVGSEIEPSFEYKVLNYEAFLPILIKGHQEQALEIQSKDSIIDSLQAQVTDLNNRLTQLENCLSGILPYLCQLSHSAIQANTPSAQEEVRKNLSVTLSNRSAIVLDQNVPNPFAEQTIINFSIPETVQKAQIHFYDGNGRFMNSVEVTERGLGSITVFGSDLSTGVYTYTLVADGQVVATKKMMKQ